MSNKVAKLWTDPWFNQQEPITKLLYIYLMNHPSLNMCGVVSLLPHIICLELNITLNQLRESTKLLVSRKLVHTGTHDGVLYFIIPQHFQSVPKSSASLERLNKVLETLPETLRTTLSGFGIHSNSMIRSFIKPTAEQVSEYAISIGYLIKGEEFVKYYDDTSMRFGFKSGWKDNRGTEVRDWKAKLRRIWCKEENKIKSFPEAPKGFETFYVIEKGAIVVPSGWRNNKPYSNSLTSDIILKREYADRLKGSS